MWKTKTESDTKMQQRLESVLFQNCDIRQSKNKEKNKNKNNK